jgi:hypothetical protein
MTIGRRCLRRCKAHARVLSARAHDAQQVIERHLSVADVGDLCLCSLKLLADQLGLRQSPWFCAGIAFRPAASCITNRHLVSQRYYAPVRRHLQPYLNDLFPGAELELGDGFTITGMKRSRSESFKRLSDGTQEQIAVLVRLAMGTLLAERGGNVPIILDDALVYCDDDRINLMFEALSRAGKHQQIIVLTCRLRSFAPLGGHTLRVQMNGA